MSLDKLNLDGLEKEDLENIEANALDILWQSDELPGGPAQNVAYSLRRLDAGLGELLEHSERGTATGDRIADAADRIADAAEKIAASLDALQKQAATFAL